MEILREDNKDITQENPKINGINPELIQDVEPIVESEPESESESETIIIDTTTLNNNDPLTKIKKETVDKLNNKDFGIYYYVADNAPPVLCPKCNNPNATKQKLDKNMVKVSCTNCKTESTVEDTRMIATAGLATVYEHVKILTDLGYKAYILHEKNDYKGVAEIFGEQYAKLPHISVESQKLKVGPADFVIIPEIFSHVMEATAKYPCKRIILCQSYDYIFEVLPAGLYWSQYGITDCITTTKSQEDYVKSLFQNLTTYIIPPSIPGYFKPYKKMQKPIICVSSRHQIDINKLIKQFFIQYPQYRWIPFKELKGLTRKDFARNLQECCLAVWIDEISGFGTFPVECFKSGVPVIAKIPNLIPDYMIEEKKDDGSVSLKKTGIWVRNQLDLPAIIHDFIKSWIEDNVPDEIYESMKSYEDQYTTEQQKVSIESVYNLIITKRIQEVNNLKAK